MAKTITELSKLQSIKLFFKHKNFAPGIGDEIRNQYHGIAKLNLNMGLYWISNPEIAHEILNGNHKDVTKSANYADLKPWHQNGLIVNEGEDWVRQRRLTSSYFIRSELEKSVPLMVNEIQPIIEKWRQYAKKGEAFDLVPDINTITFRILCQAVMGQSLDAYIDDLYSEITKIIYLFPRRSFALLKLPLSIPTPLNREINSSAKSFRTLIKKIIDNADISENSGMLSRLIQQLGRQDNDVADLVATMLAAGFETTANAINWIWVMLATYPEVQHKLQDSIKAKWDSAPVDKSFLDQLPYAQWVINESMRLYPPVLYPGRLCHKEINCDGYVLPAGSTVAMNIWSIHRHPDYWENPDQFIPERFSPEKLTKKQLKAFIPFVEGPRACQGKQLALIEIQVILFSLIREFNIQLAEGYKLEPEASIVLRPKGGLKVKVTERKSS